MNIQLEKLDNQPKIQAEKKGQISEGLRIAEKEKNENEERPFSLTGELYL